MTAIILIATKVSYQKHFPIRIYAGGMGHYVQPPPPPHHHGHDQHKDLVADRVQLNE